MAGSYNALTKAIAGLQKDYMQSGTPLALKFAPLLGSGANGQYQVLRSPKFYSLKDPNPTISLDGQHRRITQAFDTVSVEAELVDGGYLVIPQNAIDALEGANPELDVVKSSIDALMANIYGDYVTRFITAADAGFSAVGGGTLTLSSPNGTPYEFFKDAVLSIQLASGVRPTHVILGPEAVYALAQQDEVMPAHAIAVGANTVQRRLGSASSEHVANWFRDFFGLELIVEDRIIESDTGVNGFGLSTKGYLGVVAGGSAASAMKTFYLQNQGDFARFVTRPASAPDQEGVAVSASAFYKIKVVSPEMGGKFTVTLPS